MIYRVLFRLVLRHIPPETAHAIVADGLSVVGRVPGLRALVARLLGSHDPAVAVRAFGLAFPSPLGVAAGLDKNLTWFEELGALGFGFVEVGTVTAQPQPGNDRPRIERLLADRALINRMGFPNRGAAAAAQRLSNRTGRTIVAVNIGRSRTAQDVNEDYREAARRLAPLADMLVLNVSSPNTPGLRALQAVEVLERLVGAVRTELQTLRAAPPLLVKIAPDLSDGEIDAIAQAALALDLDGIVAVNTTTARDGLVSDPRARSMSGGLSGPPLRRRALEVLRQLRSTTRGRLVLISVGGVESADDVWERIRAGATLVQTYTGFVYGGPLWPSRINRDLAARVRAAGAASIEDVIGTDEPGHRLTVPERIDA